jgi:hypothetical protein
VDGTLAIENGSEINVMGTLYLQKSALSENIDMFNGLVTIDKTGKLIAQEIVAKTVVTDKLTISTPVVAGASAASIGSATIPAGSIDIPINTTAIKAGSKVFLTTTTPTGGQMPFISYQEESLGFIVALERIYSEDIRVNWWIIDTN